MNTFCRDKTAPAAGFTLLELLIALALTAVIGAVLFSTYNMVMDNGLTVRSLVLARESERIFLSVLDNDMANLCRVEDEKSGLPMLSRRPILPSPEFFRLSGLEAPETGEEQVLLSFAGGSRLADGPTAAMEADCLLAGPVCVEYRLRPERRGKALIRRERAACGVEGDFPWTEVILARGLQSLETALYTPETGWRADWNAQSAAKDFPRAVRFTFTREGGGEPEVFLSPVFPGRRDEETP